MYVESAADPALTRQLPPSWTHEDEWYVFFGPPKDARVVSYINGEQIIPDGNLLWIKDKKFGMGKYHPVAWCRSAGKGKTFYTSMGHSREVWQDAYFVRLLKNALRWTIR